MEAMNKIFRTPTAFVLLLVSVVSLFGVIIKSKSDETIARIPIDATSTAETRLTQYIYSLTSTEFAKNSTATSTNTLSATLTATAENTPTSTLVLPTLPPILTDTPQPAATNTLVKTPVILPTIGFTSTVPATPKVYKFVIRTYTVEAGDTFEKVSVYYTGKKDSVKAIKLATGKDMLRIGDQLMLPVYTVQSGDFLSVISQAFGLKTEQIEESNGLTNSNLLIIGQQLIIPINCQIANCYAYIKN